MIIEPTANVPGSARRIAMGQPRWRVTLAGVIGFLTLVDLFATQAILPSLAAHYQVTPAEIGLAANASTLGMALASVAVAILGGRSGTGNGIWLSLALLSVPTALLALAPDLATFALLRVVQGLFMATAFALTMTYLSETLGSADITRALAAYVTGIVACNLAGRMMAAYLTDTAGAPASFYAFALLNLAGAALAAYGFRRSGMGMTTRGETAVLAAMGRHLRDPSLRAAFGIGFLILFVFIGVFTYVNFVLVRPPINLGTMSLGAVYLVFLPAVLTTPLAGKTALRFGVRRSMWLGLGAAALGLPLLLAPSLALVLAGLVLVGCGTFFAQALATGYVARTAKGNRAAANGLYLASYYSGGLAGAFTLGEVFDRTGWTIAVFCLAAAILAGVLLARRLEPRSS